MHYFLFFYTYKYNIIRAQALDLPLGCVMSHIKR